MRSSVIESRRRRFLCVLRRSRGRKREFCRARRGKNVVLLLFLLFVVSVLLLLLLKHNILLPFVFLLKLFFYVSYY